MFLQVRTFVDSLTAEKKALEEALNQANAKKDEAVHIKSTLEAQIGNLEMRLATMKDQV